MYNQDGFFFFSFKGGLSRVSQCLHEGGVSPLTTTSLLPTPHSGTKSTQGRGQIASARQGCLFFFFLGRGAGSPPPQPTDAARQKGLEG